MAVAMIRKAFKDHNTRLGITDILQGLDKFALKAFNQLLHNQKVSRPLVASFLLSFPNQYSLIAAVVTINIALLKTKFELILGGQDFNQSNDIIYVDNGKVKPCLMYKHSTYHSLAFEKLNIYKYF